MPRPKVTFKETVLDIEIEGLECTVGTEIVKADRFKASLDVADLLRTELPELLESNLESVRLLDHGQKKIQVIKAVRGFTGLGLKEAKDLTEAAPSSITLRDIALKGRSLETAVQEFVDELDQCGAIYEVNRHANLRAPTVLDKLREVLTEAIRSRDEG